jgi:hypothetical protein
MDGRASGCVEALSPLDGEWRPLSLFHYSDGRGSLWGYCEWYGKHGRQTTVHPEFTGWRWAGPPVPSLEEQGAAYLVWPFYGAPGALRALSCHGGDEDWVALVPVGWDTGPAWARDGGGFGCCSVSDYVLPDGRTVLIGAHA